MNAFLIIILILSLYSLLTFKIIYYKPKNEKVEKIESMIHIDMNNRRVQNRENKKTYKGVCIFDIDGTLTEGKDNYNVVQYFLNLGYAVGVSTAGSVYTIENLRFFKWMPSNLYEFMNRNRFNTFNNVASGWICGTKNLNVFRSIDSYAPNGIDLYGWRKGFVLEQTARMFNISDPKKVVMFDDLENFVNGMKAYNNNFNIILVSPNSKYKLDLQTCRKLFNS